ncbi:MAG: response regulator [Candidatus Thiodiazotropha sp.]|jgi:two-component system, sensor histidine kinase RpfC
MFTKLFQRRLLSNLEYQQALVRLAVWVFCAVSMWFAVQTEYYSVDFPLFITLYVCYFTLFIGMAIGIVIWPNLPSRINYTLIIDISATSLAIYLTSDALSPFYLIYHWIYISYGIRYGARSLLIATILNFATYAIVLFSLQQWQTNSLEAFLFLFLLLVVPIYQYILLRQLHSAKNEAMLAKQASGSFLATITHEMCTPLTGVMGMVQLLEKTPLDAEQKEYVHTINASTRLLHSMISDVLDLSKINASKLELTNEWFDVSDMVRNIISSLASEAQEKQLEVYCWVDPDVPHKLRGDNLRISQILFNMLSNAIKFTDKGYVCLRVINGEESVGLSGRYILFEVKDTGIGIAEEKLAEICATNWQADSSNQRRYFEGAGLGTAVIRDLTHLMGGEVDVTSKVDQGSLFSVRLPLLADNNGTAESSDSQSATERFPLIKDKKVLIYESDSIAMQMHLQIVDELGMQALATNELNQFCNRLADDVDFVLVCDSLLDTSVKQVVRCVNAFEKSIPMLLAGYRTSGLSYTSINTTVLVKPFLLDDLAKAVIDLLIPHQEQLALVSDSVNHTKTSRSISVLLAEDNLIAAKVISTLLIQRGHQVKLVRDGKEALQAVNEADYELAFVDLYMPYVDGIEFAQQYRKTELQNRYMPIYALTAGGVEDMMDLCIRAGMDGFLSKPVEPEVLDTIIERCLNGGLDREQWLPTPS